MTEVLGGVDVSRETIAALNDFATLVLKWTERINLIGAGSSADIWDRHVVDSVQTFRFVPETFATWLDLGSGGGFPGIVVAIIGREKSPAARFHLMESDQRKVVFLRTAIRELKLNAEVLADRIETAPAVHADVVSARALGALPQLLPLVAQHLHPEGRAILHKGRQAGAEIAEARRDWAFDLEEKPSLTDPAARLLVIQRIKRAA